MLGGVAVRGEPVEETMGRSYRRSAALVAAGTGHSGGGVDATAGSRANALGEEKQIDSGAQTEKTKAGQGRPTAVPETAGGGRGEAETAATTWAS